MNNKDKEISAKKLRILRFSGVLAFVGTFIFALIYTGNDQFLKRCVANGNSVKYCNDIYDDRNLAFKDKHLEKEEKRRRRELEKEEKRKQRELEIAQKRRKELELAEERTKELEVAKKRIKKLELAEQRRKKLELAERRKQRPNLDFGKNISFDGSVTVGIIHSLSGTMAISESTLVDAEKLAIEEINNSGGILLGNRRYKIKYLIEDGASHWPTFADKARKLITRDRVPVVFGGWTSASRKAMLPVFEIYDSLLFYPIQYEGQECSNNIFYTGATPNQQSEPATEFMYKRSPAAGGNFFLVGSDYVFPRTSNTITKAQVKQLGGKVVGEDYLPLGNTEVAPIISKIKKALPYGGIIINTLNGDQLVAFFKQIQDAGITPWNGYYVMNYSIAEEEISIIGPEFLEGHYAAWNYMMSIDSKKSKDFISNFKKRYGYDRMVSDSQESAYNMVYLWKQAVEEAGTFDDNVVREFLVGQKFDAPQGPVEVMPNHHLSQTVRIGEINAEGRFTIIEEMGFVLPQAWNQKHPSSKGFACDWTDSSKGEKYKL